MGSPDHILVIIPGFAADENDELSIPPLQIYLKAYQKRYPETKISVITLHYPFEEKCYKWNGINVYSCGGKNKKGLNKFVTWRKAERYFKELSNENKPDIIHSFWLNETAGLGNFFAKKLQIKHVVTLMGQDARSQNRYLKIIDLQYPKLVCLSIYQAEVLKNNNYNAKPAIIPWGIDAEEFNINENNRTTDILGAGSLIPLKQFNLFIKIIAEIKQVKPDVKAVIAGTGPEHVKLLYMITAARIEDNIHLSGQLPRSELLQLMHKSKIFLHTSNYESQAYVLFEALAAGMSVVSTNVGVAGSFSEISTANSDEELKNAILEKVMNNQPHQQKIPFTIDQTIDAYRKIYSK